MTDFNAVIEESVMSAKMFTAFVLRSANQIQNIYFTVCLIDAFAGYSGHSVYLTTFLNKACKNGRGNKGPF